MCCNPNEKDWSLGRFFARHFCFGRWRLLCPKNLNDFRKNCSFLTSSLSFGPIYNARIRRKCGRTGPSCCHCSCIVDTALCVQSERKRASFPWFTGAIIFAFSLLFATISTPASANICKSQNIKGVMSELATRLDGCTVIEGHLIIAMIDEEWNLDPENKFENLSFPLLREITDYFLIYQSSKLTHLSTLFPNLTVIRGNRLIKDFALIIYQMTNLEEVGLISLTHILRGGVRIEKNPRLCYVDTIDWRQIIDLKYHSRIHIEENEHENRCPKFCPDVCKHGSNSKGVSAALRGRHLCWNERSCQIVSEKCPSRSEESSVCYRVGSSKNNGQLMICSDKCIGGCFDETRKGCFSCRDVFWSGNETEPSCRKFCPYPFLVYEGWRCIPATECMKLTYDYKGQSAYYKSYDGKCLEECPPKTQEVKYPNGTLSCQVCEDCPKDCRTGVITSLEDLERLEGCTKIVGDITIQIFSGEGVVQALEKYLHAVKIITGSLKISRSFPIISLDFFKSLQEIQGIRNPNSIIVNNAAKQYSLEILENENLQKLFPIPKSGYGVQIRARDSSGNSSPGKAFIHYNPKLCKGEIKRMLNASGMANPDPPDISYSTNGDKAVCTSNKLNLNVSSTDRKVLTLTFNNYYEQIVASGHDYRALLKYEVHYREISEATFRARNLTKYQGRDAGGGDEWTIFDHSPTEQQIKDKKLVWPLEVISINIKPYTYYAVFVTTMIIRGIGGTSDDIEGAESDIVYALTPEDNPSSPQHIRIKHLNYSSVNITWSEPLSPNGIIDHYELVLKIQNISQERIAQLQVPFCRSRFPVHYPPRPSSTTGKIEVETGVVVGSKNKSTTVIAKQDNCDCSNCKPMTPKQPDEREKLEEDIFHDELIDRVFVPVKSGKSRRSIDSGSNNLLQSATTALFTDKKDGSKIYRSVPSTQRSIVISDLHHFSSYTLKIRACHAKAPDLPFPRCSLYVIKEIRTLAKPNADNIESGLKFVSNSGRKTNDSDNSVWITWEPPKAPNMLVVNYNILMRTHKDRGDSSKTDNIACITASQFKEDGYKYQLTRPGSYYVKVQAVTLNGPGGWTPYIFVTVPDSNSYLLFAILIPIMLILLLVAGGVAYTYVKHSGSRGTEITPNDLYVNTEDVYIIDEWEVARERVEVGEKLGGGAFGIVFSGKYDCPREERIIDCAIKTVKDTQQCRTFLGEAQVMKKFNTPHVVKLLGVVSQGQPLYVLLEMMAHGSLKEYLSSLRDSKEVQKRRISEQEFIQMAIEIADGMAYLSTIKDPHPIVHCDLAARNCLVADPPVIKIGDFGMAHEIYSDYYKKGNHGMMPVRWMAPESLRYGKFTQASDVWSFGVVLWEMVTLAEQPYQGMGNEGALRYIINGGTMEKPNDCPHSIYALMKECWRQLPEDRPSFIDICHRLLPHANERFRKNSFITSDEARVIVTELQKSRETQLQELEDQLHVTTPLKTDSSGRNGDLFLGSSGDSHRGKESNNGLVAVEDRSRSSFKSLNDICCQSDGEMGTSDNFGFPMHVSSLKDKTLKVATNNERGGVLFGGFPSRLRTIMRHHHHHHHHLRKNEKC